MQNNTTALQSLDADTQEDGSGTPPSQKNLCLCCGIDMGDMNPRQYCYKTYCPKMLDELMAQVNEVDPDVRAESSASTSRSDRTMSPTSDPGPGRILKQARVYSPDPAPAPAPSPEKMDQPRVRIPVISQSRVIVPKSNHSGGWITEAELETRLMTKIGRRISTVLRPHRKRTESPRAVHTSKKRIDRIAIHVSEEPVPAYGKEATSESALTQRTNRFQR